MILKEIIKERWKFYLLGYIIGYIASIRITGVPSIVYLIPIKLIAIFTAMMIGTAFYYGHKKVPVYEVPLRLIKYMMLFIVITLIFKLIYVLLLRIGIDITPLLGTTISAN